MAPFCKNLSCKMRSGWKGKVNKKSKICQIEKSYLNSRIEQKVTLPINCPQWGQGDFEVAIALWFFFHEKGEKTLRGHECGENRTTIDFSSEYFSWCALVSTVRYESNFSTSRKHQPNCEMWLHTYYIPSL